ncbi:MAG: hypothetical protein ACLFVJ_20190 [Persicimonas sp.]
METGDDKSDRRTHPMKTAGIIALGAAGAVLAAWLFLGAHMVTQYQVGVTEIETDEFGDEVETTVMEDRFRFGLLPDQGYDGAAPWSGGLALVGVSLLVAARLRPRGDRRSG